MVQGQLGKRVDHLLPNSIRIDAAQNCIPVNHMVALDEYDTSSGESGDANGPPIVVAAKSCLLPCTGDTGSLGYDYASEGAFFSEASTTASKREGRESRPLSFCADGPAVFEFAESMKDLVRPDIR